MGTFENKNYVSTEIIDGKVDKLNLDKKALVKDAKQIAEKLKSWNRREFQNEIIETINTLNNKFENEKELLKDEKK